jgi:hypothetical protein
MATFALPIIKTLQAGDCVGYGASWSANQQTTIAIIATITMEWLTVAQLPSC